MSHQPSTGVGRVRLVLLAGALCLAGAACASDEVTMPEDLQIGTLPSASDGASCTDPTGDISSTVSATAGALGDPTGIDLVEATADVGADDLTVTFRTNGPIGEVTEPVFSMIQGVSGQEDSFELRARPDAGGAWTISLITWDEEAGGLRESDPQPMAAAVDVDGSRLSFVIPLRDLPKLATIVWQFGASGIAPPAPPSTARVRVFDDCNNMGQQGSPGSSETTAAPPVPPASDASSPLGTELTSDDEITATVFAFEMPAADAEPLTVPPEDGYEVAVVDAEVCAGGQDVTIGPANFYALTSTNELWQPWDPPQAARLPAFPQRSLLTAGSCVRGWVTYELPAEATITDVVFAPESGGSETGTLLWTVR